MQTYLNNQHDTNGPCQSSLMHRYAHASVAYYGDPKLGTSLGIARTYPGPMIAAENVSTRGAWMMITSSAWQRRRR